MLLNADSCKGRARLRHGERHEAGDADRGQHGARVRKRRGAGGGRHGSSVSGGVRQDRALREGHQVPRVLPRDGEHAGQ